MSNYLPGSQAVSLQCTFLTPPPPQARKKFEPAIVMHQQTFQPLSHANLEVLKTSPEKPGDWDLKPGDFQNMCQIIKKALFV